MYFYLFVFFLAGIGLFWYAHKWVSEEFIRVKVNNYRLRDTFNELQEFTLMHFHYYETRLLQIETSEILAQTKEISEAISHKIPLTEEQEELAKELCKKMAGLLKKAKFDKSTMESKKIEVK